MNFGKYQKRISEVLLNTSRGGIDSLVLEVLQCAEKRKTVFVCGNGGSACTANHFAEDLASVMRGPSALSLCCNAGWITAIANDFAYEELFSRQLAKLALPGDLLVAISCSGTSQNVLLAVKFAKVHKINCVGMTGDCGGGTLSTRCDQSIYVPDDNFGIVESVHLSILHYVVDRVREVLEK